MSTGKIINFTVTLALAAGLVYLFTATPYRNAFKNITQQYFPCQRPIPYYVGSFDDSFGITQSEFLAAVKSAEDIWEESISRDLFSYAAKGDLKLNLIYDYRQEATDKLQDLGIEIKDDEATYKALKTKYNSLKASYDRLKVELDAEIADYEKRKKAYENEVEYWNRRGGAPKQEYAELTAEKKALDAMSAEIRADQDRFNATVSDLNALVTVLNRLASELNLQAEQYNQIGTERGEEFQEGVFKWDSSGRQIDIYEFESKDKLIRVLTHELGHALGLEHTEDPDSIMYRLNISQNETLSADDLQALKERCGI